jgi:nuclear protein localization family protein 4
LEDDKEDKVEEIANALGLVRVGWIFTDLVSDAQGQIRHFRSIDTHFLSAQVSGH